MDEIKRLTGAEQLRKVPNGGYGGALIKANMLAAAHNLKTYPRTYWAEHPQAFAEQVDILRRGVRFFTRVASKAEEDGRQGTD